LIDSILKNEENLDLGIVTYNILPTSKTAGIIEIIENSETIYSIQENLKSSILNFILENNEDSKVRDIRDTFINSTAVYSVITYLFGIGDRHLDNIMVTTSGKLFHIDYGYILGYDPVVTNPGIRITPEIIDAIGGLSSKNYEKFTELCSRIYNCLRRNIDIFMNMLIILPKISDIKISEDDIRNLLISRFIPGESQINSRLHLVNQLEKQNYIYKIKDLCHYHSKEKTVSSAVNRLSHAIASLVIQSMPEDKSNLNNSQYSKR
jgi:phosphatidylinositol kinase/protein kinase (PI-3  family)